MPNDKEHYVGIDMAKDWFDVAVLGQKRTEQFANTKKGIRELVWWMSKRQPKLPVVEATRGASPGAAWIFGGNASHSKPYRKEFYREKQKDWHEASLIQFHLRSAAGNLSSW